MTKKRKEPTDNSLGIKLTLISTAGAVLVALITIAPSVFKGSESDESGAEPYSATINQSIGDEASISNSTVITGNDVQIQNVENERLYELAEKTFPESIHPVVDLSVPIKRQLRVFAEDEIEIVGWTDRVTEVWFGKRWEPFNDHKVYTVWGTPGKPITPKFKGYGEIKLKISFVKYRDARRDLRDDEFSAHH
ncbi:hypothetical protein [Cerasicoccus frondis]|uniref:hypothetical protein n=1 Tax=Cerasicoccus frondis TaxID=490090 RepID=UPI002852A825|nr:hypothetical protein [Cerasicoccus frondis]